MFKKIKAPNRNPLGTVEDKAFTLIELLVVIAIVGILSGFIFVSMNNATNAAKDAKRKADLATIQHALLAYQASGNDLPATACTLGVSNCLSEVLPNPPIDSESPSKNYTYTPNGSSFVLTSTLSNNDTYSYNSASGWQQSSSPFATWLKKKTVTISNGGTALTDYQVKLTVAYDSDMQPDFDDLRFATTGGLTLSYWIESKVDSNTATVWVKVPAIANPLTDIVMYYKKADAVTNNSGSDTFIFFDHFTNPVATYDTGKWATSGGTQSVSNSILSDTGNVDVGIYEKNSLSTLGTASRMYSNFGSPSTWSRMGIALGNYYGGSFLQSGTYGGGWVAETCLVQPDRVWTNISIGSGYHVYEITRTDSTHTSFYSDGSLLATNTQKIGTTSVAAFSFTANGGPINTDWVALRKYRSPEPISNFSPEQDN